MRSSHALSLVAALLLCGCGTTPKKEAIATALDVDAARPELFEATLRVLDENPTYVDELFRQAMRHPRTMDRFLANAAAHLDDEQLAQMTARNLVQNPAGLHEVLIQTLDAARADPDARASIARAIAERSQLAAGIITDDAEHAEAVLEATINTLLDKPQARLAFLTVMQRRTPEIARIIANNPKTLRSMMKAVLEVGAQESKELVRELIGLPADKGAK
jgi:hypothetical protein